MAERPSTFLSRREIFRDSMWITGEFQRLITAAAPSQPDRSASLHMQSTSFDELKVSPRLNRNKVAEISTDQQSLLSLWFFAISRATRRKEEEL
ncbi:MAG: hypothetical protein A2Z06_04455 [Candidatus Glassbacteria bacterium RBG_16_58_8]|uniref:Uncharacterized protein n=1 Tax=Candidatus Glassbacteria bacterium RBG_16_58_8 TaxID=1817866 RepID=A0A1F5YDA5_9BACT|nr:MAG: hypothetical protein A2Z06_04455 [Candidatus Glassbacteria bacterium RBG_16_58_8]